MPTNPLSDGFYPDAYQETDPIIEDYASALGHIIISFNALEAALLVLARQLWPDHELEQITRQFGRRSMDERLTMMAHQISASAVARQRQDELDRLLGEIRHLTEQRNAAIHAKHDFYVQSESGQAITVDDNLLARLWELSTNLDHARAQVAMLCG